MTTPAIRDAMALFTLVDSPSDPTELGVRFAPTPAEAAQFHRERAA